VGLLIDDAIVVRENIVRHQAMGKHHKTAAFDGTAEIGLAVAATTFTIVAVFMPIGFMQGIIGKFFHEFGITIVAAVLISMFVSFTLDPMLSSVWRDPSIHAPGHRPPAGDAADRRRDLRAQRGHGADAGHRVRAQGGFLGDQRRLPHAAGLVAGGHRGQGAPAASFSAP